MHWRGAPDAVEAGKAHEEIGSTELAGASAVQSNGIVAIQF
ncbi:hypothetical protein [uncultured Erythrobacter sp.]|nr:hypothetical protein [uncultured Erythrobacter sp.]